MLKQRTIGVTKAKPACVTILLCLVLAVSALGQTTEFTYQGSLKTGGVNANGSYDFIFALFDAASGGSPLGSQLIRDGVPVTDGLFVVNLDFGSQFPGANRFLQISVRQQPNIHTQLAPRQQIRSVPYSIKSLNSENAMTSTNALQLGGVAANQYVLTGDARLSDARNPLPGSQNYIQNTTPGGGSNFNVNGTGSANILNAATQFNLADGRILSNGGTNNLFAGINSGSANTGFGNSFFGRNAGRLNTSGASNSIFGAFAGDVNTTGGSNSFFGSEAGLANTTASNNSFFGAGAGRTNTTGESNTFIGRWAGLRNLGQTENTFVGQSAGEFNGNGDVGNTASGNTFVGSRAGFKNTTAFSNSFFGNAAGVNNTTASQNAFFGALSGFANDTGNSNAFFGYRSGFANNGSLNAFFGFNAGSANIGGVQNSFFGGQAGAANTSGNSNAFFAYQSGSQNTTASGNSFFGNGSGKATTTGGSNSFFGASAGFVNTIGASNAFFASGAGSNNTTGSFNTFVGSSAGAQNTTGGSNVFLGTSAGNPNMATQVSNSVAIGAFASVSTSNTIVLGSTLETTQIPGALTSGIFNGISGIPVLRAFNTPAGGGVASPNFYLTGFSQLASPNHLCWRTVVDGAIQGNALTNCSGDRASVRYKEQSRPFEGGLSIIKRLNPVAFKWKADGTDDLGLNAEDVAAIEPRLVTLGANGEVESIREQGMNAVFINAIKEQQAQIESQQQSMRQMQLQIEALKALVCTAGVNAAVCRVQEK